MRRMLEILTTANVGRPQGILVSVVEWLSPILPCSHFIMLMIRDLDTIWKRGLFSSGNLALMGEHSLNGRK